MLRRSRVSEKFPTRGKQNKIWKSIAFYPQYHERRYDNFFISFLENKDKNYLNKGRNLKRVRNGIFSPSAGNQTQNLAQAR